MLKRLVAGTDYFAKLGPWARISAMIVLIPFALLFSLGAICTPIAACCIAWKTGEGQLAGIVLLSGLLYLVLAFPVVWLVYRLYTAKISANGTTILPTWLVRTFLLSYLGPLTVGMVGYFWLICYRALLIHNWSGALFFGAAGLGFAVSWLRAVQVAYRLKPTSAESSPPKSAQS